MPKWIGSYIKESDTNLSSDMAIAHSKKFLRAMAQPFVESSKAAWGMEQVRRFAGRCWCGEGEWGALTLSLVRARFSPLLLAPSASFIRPAVFLSQIKEKQMGLDPNRDKNNDADDYPDGYDDDVDMDGPGGDGGGEDDFDRAFGEIDDAALSLMSFDTGVMVEPAH